MTSPINAENLTGRAMCLIEFELLWLGTVALEDDWTDEETDAFDAYQAWAGDMSGITEQLVVAQRAFCAMSGRWTG